MTNNSAQTLRIALIGCSKTKVYKHNPRVGGRVFPSELYAGRLFKDAVAHAESRDIPWFVLSARFGLWASGSSLNPGEYDAATKTWAPYNETIKDMDKAERAIWHTKVAWDVIHQLWEPWHTGESDSHIQPSELTVEIHAGKAYSHPLAEILSSVGCRVELPLQGMGYGNRRCWYKQQRERLPAGSVA